MTHFVSVWNRSNLSRLLGGHKGRFRGRGLYDGAGRSLGDMLGDGGVGSDRRVSGRGDSLDALSARGARNDRGSRGLLGGLWLLGRNVTGRRLRWDGDGGRKTAETQKGENHDI